MERKLGCSDAQTACIPGQTRKADGADAPARTGCYPEGWFPETAFDIEDETFCLVCMDACLYRPTLAGLEFFFPRMEEEASSS